MGSTEEAFCLKWNDFPKERHFFFFAELRRDSDLTDITIVVEGTHLKAHKVILSACSGAFKDLFRSGISKDPIVMLWDVSAEDMEALFNFMYQGQVNVVQERLNTFLDLAERLRVKGLTNKSAEDEEDEEIHKSPRRPTSSVHSRSNTPNTTTNTSTSNDHNRKRLTGNSPSSNSSNKKQRVKDESDSEDKSVDKTHPIVMIKQESGKISTGGTDGDDRNDGINEMDDSSYGGEYNNDYFDTEGEQFTEDMIQGTSHDFTSAESNKESRHENCSCHSNPVSLCGKVFSSKPKMLKHKTLKHHGEARSLSSSSSSAPMAPPQPSNCPYCGKFFDTRQGMNGHTAHCTLRPKSIVQSPHSNQIITTSSSEPSISSGGSSSNSLTTAGGITMAVCPDCGRLFQSKHQMYGHRAHCKARVPPPPKKTVMPPLPTQTASCTASTSQGICPWCNKSFVKLNRHIEDIHFPVPTKCDVCHKEFASRHKMQNHRHTAHKSRPNITSTNTTVSSSPESFCPYCQRGFDSKHKMHGHIGRCSQRPSRINLQSSWNLP
ncbi:unnamed protein product [Lepeophtheirus salmonis]|nr:unnamed protein product [Lepeophtheirus salmonis]CAF2858583.1 unnamed protein product [Lepeophtheirus salmonis]